MVYVVKEHLRKVEADMGNTAMHMDLLRLKAKRAVEDIKIHRWALQMARSRLLQAYLNVHLPNMLGNLRWLIASLEGAHEQLSKSDEKWIDFQDEEWRRYKERRENLLSRGHEKQQDHSATADSPLTIMETHFWCTSRYFYSSLNSISDYRSQSYARYHRYVQKSIELPSLLSGDRRLSAAFAQFLTSRFLLFSNHMLSTLP